MRICHQCGSKLQKNTKFCPECGINVICEKDFQTNGKGIGGKNWQQIVLILLLIVGALVYFALDGANWFKSAAGDKTTETTTAPQIAFSDDPSAISAASQSVVKLSCYDKNGDLYSTGSGFACFASNVIITNYHIIKEDVRSIEASTENGNTFDITYILATDEEKDIAILGSLVPHNLALLQPGKSNDLQKGVKVVTIGSPLGLLNSVSTGVFSGYVAEKGMDILQFTAPISNGSSGGALFNNEGKVLGITFASYKGGQNLNLAIPIECAEQVYLNRDIMTRINISERFSSDVDEVVICNKELKLYHSTGTCGDAMLGNMRLKGTKENKNYIRISILEAIKLGYKECKNCSSAG